MKTLIEVGAFEGSDSLRYHNNGYIVYTFEPKKDLYINLLNKTKDLTNYTVIPKAVSLSNGTTTINIFDYSSNTALLNNGSFYIKCNVVATNLCIKFSTFIFDNEIVTSTGSQNVIYKDASFVSCGLYLNAGVLSVEIVMNENLVALSMCKCKTKIVSPV